MHTVQTLNALSTVGEQTEQAWSNVEAILCASGSTLDPRFSGRNHRHRRRGAALRKTVPSLVYYAQSQKAKTYVGG